MSVSPPSRGWPRYFLGGSCTNSYPLLCIRVGVGLTPQISMTAAGKDRVGWVYLDMATRAAKEYDVAHPFRPIDEEPVRTMEIATNETLWGIFNMCW